MLNKETPLQLGRFLDQEKALDVTILDISAQSSFADYFVIATVSSVGQLRGLLRNLDEQLMALSIHAKGLKRTITDDEQWLLIDCGDLIIHLMTKPARDFYALEKLWFDSPCLDLQSGELVQSV